MSYLHNFAANKTKYEHPLQIIDLQGSCFSQVTYNISITSERVWTR